MENDVKPATIEAMRLRMIDEMRSVMREVIPAVVPGLKADMIVTDDPLTPERHETLRKCFEAMKLPTTWRLPPGPDPVAVPIGLSALHQALDALLRFVVGHPDGERWMGKEAVTEMQTVAERMSMARGDWKGNRVIDASRVAPDVLRLLATIPGASAARWLSAQDQREYERLHAALVKAVRA